MRTAECALPKVQGRDSLGAAKLGARSAHLVQLCWASLVLGVALSGQYVNHFGCAAKLHQTAPFIERLIIQGGGFH